MPDNLNSEAESDDITGMNETVEVNSNKGRLDLRIPVHVTDGRSQFTPELALIHSGGIHNGPFGMGWDIPVPKIFRQTDRQNPSYNDHKEQDVFAGSGFGELVPVRHKNGLLRSTISEDKKYRIHRYRPRVESDFRRIEKWVDRNSGIVHWKTINGDGVTSIYGKSRESRVADPEDATRIYVWLLEKTFDERGNCQSYEYKKEDLKNVDAALASEKHRFRNKSFPGRYLKRIHYGNSKPCKPEAGELPDGNRWHFQVVFDYGEHDSDEPEVDEKHPWPVRPDPFSVYKPGFEIRTYRLCRRILLFHHIDELGTEPVLTSSYDIEYNFEEGHAKAGVQISSVSYSGYRTDKDGKRWSKKIPPLTFDYTRATPDNEIQHLEQKLDGFGDQPADLYGEGVNGLLHQLGDQWYYKENQGQGRFSEMQPVQERPASAASFNLTDLDGNGKPDLAKITGQTSGYHELKKNYEGWEAFQPLEDSAHLDFGRPQLEMIDHTGDGLADLSVRENGGLSYYPSEGKKGFGKSRRISLPSDFKQGPPKTENDQSQGFFIANLSGSRQDIVRVRNGHICYWPSLGYGKFGRCVEMDHAPLIDHQDMFDPSRLRFIDLTGSGISDLLYLGGDKPKYWINESGNSFSDARTFEAFPPVNSHTTVQVMDLLGEGTPCLVWFSTLPRHSQSPVRYIRLIGETPSFLLASCENNMGKETKIRYTSSARFYLKDKEEGNTWKSRISSHIPVVEKIEHIDHVTDSRMHSRYIYRDGYFDGDERVFRGFSYVEQYDTEVYKEYAGLESDHYSAPVCARIWYHNGSPEMKLTGPGQNGKKDTSAIYNGDQKASPPLQSVIENEDDLDDQTLLEACQSLAGRVIRREVFSDTASEDPDHPFKITEYSWRVRCLQPATDDQYGSFLPYRSESLERNYEKNPLDPRITHQVTLDVDDFGYSERTCILAYPRREGQGARPQQEKLHTLVNENDYVHIDNGTFRHGVEIEERSWELSGFSPDGEIFTWSELHNLVEEALVNPVEYDGSIEDSASSVSRRISWKRTYYYDKNGRSTRETDQLSTPVLLHHEETAVFNNPVVEKAYQDRVDDSMLRTLGYIQQDGYWWKPAPVYSYKDRQNFHLLKKANDPLGGSETYEYDLLNLTVSRISDGLGNSRRIDTDYLAFKPFKEVDPNENVAEMLYDPLGNLMVRTIYGESLNDGGEKSDVGDEPLEKYQIVEEPQTAEERNDFYNRMINDPASFLQEATFFYWIDLNAWHRSRQAGATRREASPVSFFSIARETHSRSLEDGEESRLMVNFSYRDGFGRHIQTKQKADAGPAFIREPDGTITEKENVSERWLTTGGVVYNNKGQPVKKYEPLFTGTAGFEPEETFLRHGVSPVFYYDPLGRHVKTDTPKGFFRERKITPWDIQVYDENDTVKRSFYYESKVETGLVRGSEKDAVEKAEEHAETPGVIHMDPLGREFSRQEYPKPDQQNSLETFTQLDIFGNAIRVEDPRQRKLNSQRAEEDRVYTFDNIFDMTGRPLWVKSQDAGVKRSLPDVLDRPVHHWSPRGYHTVKSFDELSRLTSITVDEEEQDSGSSTRKVEVFRYGEDLSDSGEARARNAMGRLIEHRDQAGIKDIRRYTISGQPLETRRRLRTVYKEEADWQHDLEVEDEVFVTNYTYDVPGRIIQKKTADGSVHVSEYLLHGPLKRIRVTNEDGSVDEEVIREREYNVFGQKTKERLGNGVHRLYKYENTTRRLIRLHSTHRDSDPADGDEVETRTIQEIGYTYDPVGNITRKEDLTRAHLLNNLPSSHTESQKFSDYTYDAFYRLTKATGWTHQSLRQHDYASSDLPPEAFKGTRHLSLNNGDLLVPYSRFYSYDEAGNMTRMRQTGEVAWTRDMWVSETSNRSLPEERQDGLPRQNPAGSFDADGNVVKLDHLDGPLRWNYRNELLQATIIERTDNVDDAEYFAYDSNGMRIRKMLEKLDHGIVVKTEKIYLEGCEIKRKYRGNRKVFERWTTHVTDGDQKVALVHSWRLDERREETDTEGAVALHYQLDDHLGSSSIELDGQGKLISYEEYFPFGRTAFIAGDKIKEVKRKDYRYSGKERDDETGLYYYGFRYYAPWLGRWLNPDPAGPVDGLNLYEFVRGNPINRMDLLGLQSDLEETFQEKRDEFEWLGRQWIDGSIYHIYEHEEYGYVGRETYRAISQTQEGDYILSPIVEADLLTESELYEKAGRIQQLEFEPMVFGSTGSSEEEVQKPEEGSTSQEEDEISQEELDSLFETLDEVISEFEGISLSESEINTSEVNESNDNGPGEEAVESSSSDSEDKDEQQGVGDVAAGVGSGVVQFFTGSSPGEIADAYDDYDGGLMGTLNAIDRANPFARMRESSTEAYERHGGGLEGTLSAVDAINPFAGMRDAATEAYESHHGGLEGTLMAIDAVNPFARIRDMGSQAIESGQKGDYRSSAEDATMATLTGLSMIAGGRGLKGSRSRRRNRNENSNNNSDSNDVTQSNNSGNRQSSSTEDSSTRIQLSEERAQHLLDASEQDVRWMAGDPDLHQANIAAQSRRRSNNEITSENVSREWDNHRSRLNTQAGKHDLDIEGLEIHHFRKKSEVPGEVMSGENLYVTPNRDVHTLLHRAQDAVMWSETAPGMGSPAIQSLFNHASQGVPIFELRF